MQNLYKKLADLTEEELSRLYMSVFNTENGQIVLEDLRNRCFDKHSTVIEHAAVDPFQVVYKEGRRSVLLMIETQLAPIESAEQEKQENE